MSSLADQHYYFDEVAERVCFPPLFPVSLISCAILEKKWKEHYDFERTSEVYTSHQISVDRHLQQVLSSNDRLDILVEGPYPDTLGSGVGGAGMKQNLYRCYGLLSGNRVLYRALVHTADLSQFAPGSSAER